MRRHNILFGIIFTTLLNAVQILLLNIYDVSTLLMVLVMAFGTLLSICLAALVVEMLATFEDWVSRLVRLSRADKKRKFNESEINKQYSHLGFEAARLARQKNELIKLNEKYGKHFMESRDYKLRRVDSIKREIYELEEVFEDETPIPTASTK